MEFLRTIGERGRRKFDKTEQPERNRHLDYKIEARPERDGEYHNWNDTKADRPERYRSQDYYNPISTEYQTGRTLYQERKYAEAEPLLLQSIEMREKALGVDHVQTLETKHMLGHTLHKQHRYAEAEQLLRQLAEQREQVLGTDHVDTLESKHWLARSLCKLERYEESEQLLSEIFRLREQELGVDHKDTLESKFWLARTLYEQDENFAAKRLLRELLEQEQSVLGVDHKNTKGTEKLLRKAIAATGRFIPPRAPASEELLHKAVPAQPTIADYVFASGKVPAIPTSSFISATKVAREAVAEAVRRLEKPTADNGVAGIAEEKKAATEKAKPLVEAAEKVREEAEKKEKFASKEFSSEIILVEEPVDSADAIESVEFSHNVLLEQAPTTPTDSATSKGVSQAESRAQAQVASTISLEDIVQTRLSDFFADDNQRRTAYTDSEIQRVSTLLRQFNLPWSKVPRTYIVLRTIGCLDLLNTFVDLGYSDHWFPITERSLPPSLRPSKRSQFVAAQNLIMTKSMDFEKGQHCFFRKHERLPLEMKEILGTSAHGQVHRVLSSISFQEYALKRVPRTTVFGGRGTEFVKQFIAEIQVLKRIKHDHVVEFVGSYTDPKHMGLLMLPVADMDLSTYLERVDMAKHRELRTFFGCLARALEFLHEQKIRHKDIKPSNILVHGGKVLYTDFGLALDFTDKDGSTTGSMVNGRTAKYCAPEVADCESRNTSSDIWSLGVVFLEMTAVLKGKTVGDIYEFLKRHGTGQAFVRTNPPGTAALIAQLKDTGSPIDNAALVWVQDMIMLQQQLRPTANLLIGDIITAGQEEGGNGAFCGICCTSHDDLSSDLDEFEIAGVN